MTDLPPSPDDEIVSAVLDGEATDAERARVASDPELARRLTELRGVSTAVAEPVAPLDELTAHRLVDRAIDDAGAGPAPPRTSPRWWQSGLGVGIGSAAVVVLLALAVVPVLLSGGGSDDDSATADLETTEADGGEAGDDAGSLADDGARAPDAEQEAAPPGDDGGDGDADLGARQWLGSFDTADELAGALPQRLNEPGTADADPTTTTSTATSAFGAHDDLAELVPECPAGPGGTWPAELQPPFEVFDALIDDTAVVVITGIDAAGEPIVVVVETGTCAPVELP